MDKNNPVVNKQDQRIAIIVASIIVLGLFIYLKLAYYLMADPPPKIYPLVTSMDLPAEINLKEMKIEGKKRVNKIHNVEKIRGFFFFYFNRI